MHRQIGLEARGKAPSLKDDLRFVTMEIVSRESSLPLSFPSHGEESFVQKESDLAYLPNFWDSLPTFLSSLPSFWSQESFPPAGFLKFWKPKFGGLGFQIGGIDFEFGFFHVKL